MFYNSGIILFTLFIGFFLQIMPFPEMIWMLKPHWLLFILLYWILAIPGKASFLPAFSLGLFYDLFSGSFLGLHAFIFVFLSYIVALRAPFIRNYALWHQLIIIVILSLFYDLLLYFFQAILLNMINLSPLIFVSSLSDLALWITLTFCLKSIRLE